MSCEYVQQYYGVPACIGRRVIVHGQPGVIEEDRGHYIGVNFDSDKPGHVFNAHPTDNVSYLGMGTIRKMTRSAARYREYIRSDCDVSFAEWLGIDNREALGER
jgi:hypothetical protein